LKRGGGEEEEENFGILIVFVSLEYFIKE